MKPIRLTKVLRTGAALENRHPENASSSSITGFLAAFPEPAAALASEILVRHSHEGGRARYRTSGTDVKSEVRISEPGSDFKDQYLASEIDDEKMTGFQK